jgi:hypothetical protein
MRTTVSTFAFVGLLWPAIAAADPCSDIGTVGSLIERLAESGNVEPSLAAAFCEDYGRMAERLTDAEVEADLLRTRLAEIEAAAPPADAVLLVDRAQGCPAGWVDLAVTEASVFAGRVPVAVGFSEEREQRVYRQLGGSETHRLTEAELPPHGHGLPLGFVRLPGDDRAPSGLTMRMTTGTQVAVSQRTGRETTDRTGGAQPHANMPPFVALFFCKRE